MGNIIILTPFLTIQQVKMNWTICAMTISLCIWAVTSQNNSYTRCARTYDCPEPEVCSTDGFCMNGCDEIRDNCKPPLPYCNYSYKWCTECLTDSDCSWMGPDSYCEIGFCVM